MATSWTEHARQTVAPIWERILEHPFIAELRDGTLPSEKLIFYFEQNVPYIDTVMRCRAIAAAKSTSHAERDFFLDRTPVIAEELRHQEQMLQTLGGNPKAPIAPACHGYTRHILNLAWSGKPVQYFGAFLPCPLTYDQIGQHLKGQLKVAAHQDWWEFYSSREHNEMCENYTAYVDEHVAELTPAEREQLLKNFVLSTKYEYWFWDMAYNMEKW
jgi:thiaminase/transcriptional activator TenA